MPKRSGKQDINEKAFAVVQRLTGQAPEQKSDKNPHAIELGRLGGLKGGRARANKLTAEQRRNAAKRAARLRWSKH
jgi:hypothetical protein